MVSHLNSFKYVEMDGEFKETPCQAFEVVLPTVAIAKISSDMPKADKVVPRMVSFKDARAAVEDGSCATWGKLPKILFKADKCGLGFTIKAQKEVRCAHAGKPHLRIRNHEVNVVEDSHDECAFEEWVYPTTIKLNNWRAKDFVPIYFIEE